VPEPSDHGDGQRRQAHPRVLRRDPGVVPKPHLAQEDLREQRSRELERLLHPGQVVDHRHRAEGGGDVDHPGAELLLKLGHLLVGKRRVGGAEVDGLSEELAHAAARADRLVVDPDAGELVVLGEVLGVEGIGEGRAGAV